MAFPMLVIPDTLATSPGPGNTDPRVLERLYLPGVADHMQKDVIRGMMEAKAMLREVFGTKNVHLALQVQVSAVLTTFSA